jgi:cell division septation protein DedD
VKPKAAATVPAKSAERPQLAQVRTVARRKEAPSRMNTPRERPTDPEPIRGSWRIQLGAFSQRSSAEALYRELSGKPALSGHDAVYVPNGSMTRLQVGPFATRAAALEACSSLKLSCFPVEAR